MTNITAVFFDFDGTIFNLTVDWKRLKESIYGLIGLRHYRTGQLFETIFSIEDKSLRKKIIDLVTKEEINGAKEGNIVPGAKRFILKCQKKQMKTAIISQNSKKAIKLGLTIAKLPFPDLLLGREDVSSLKPDSEGAFRAFKKLRVEAKETIYIGDSEVDKQFARSAGIRFIYFSNWTILNNLI